MSSVAVAVAVVLAGVSLHARPPSALPKKSLHRLRGGAVDESGGTSETWDYVIIGGGAAGCVLAERLSADPENRVLLLEAGTDGSRDMRIRVPAGLVKVFKSERDWDFDTEPVPGTNRGVYLCRGKVLGGSSSTNVMLYHRGTPADYDSWVQKGAVGWGPSEVLDYFRRAEDNRAGGASQYHGTGGPMPVDDVPYVNELSTAFLEACGGLGYRRNLDFNDWSAPQDGFGRFKVTQNNGERCSAHNAYLQNSDAMRRPNLRVCSGAHVTKVHLEGAEADLCASGVAYVDDKAEACRAQLAAGGEVLLCAGAVQSPQILMLSGVGPRAHLEELGIDVRKDVPGVGDGLQDHPAVLVSYGSKKHVSITDEIKWMGSSLPNPVTLLRWLLYKRGALTSVACEFGGFFRTAKEHAQPDLQVRSIATSPPLSLLSRPSSPTPLSNLQVRFIAARAMSADGISTLEKMGAGAKMASGYTCQIIAVRPSSAGKVRLRSADPIGEARPHSPTCLLWPADSPTSLL